MLRYNHNSEIANQGEFLNSDRRANKKSERKAANQDRQTNTFNR